jgi:MoaA/NifB/PqqE/SkfB family radical SAM enzyme/GT2 family glycosyltransferase
MATLLNLFLRTGFRGQDSEGSSWRRKLEPIADVHEYPLGAAMSDLRQAVQRGSAPYLVFADESVSMADETVEKLARMLHRNRSIPGTTLSTDALERLFRLAPQERRADAVPQSCLQTDRVPSWFCVLNRRVLDNDLWACEYATLEFMLLDLGRRLRDRGQGIFLLEDSVAFDARHWIRDLLGAKARELQEDLARYSRATDSTDAIAEIPPQFRIKVVGEFDPDPDTPPSRTRHVPGAPRFTVICPAYKPTFIRQMVESVLEQTYDDWELRILIDGPPERDRQRILEILGEYRDPRVIVTEQENAGTGPTRRRLAQAARGEYLLTVDDDDMLVPRTLEVFASAIERYPKVDFFRGGARIVGLVERYHAPRLRVIVDGISADTFEVTQPFVIRRTALERLGGFEGDAAIKGAGEDTDLFLKVDRAGTRTVIIDRALYRRRLSLSNQSLGFDLPAALGHLETIQERFTPRSWVLVDRLHEEDGHSTVAILTYADLQTGSEIICPTRYFSYQTVGDTSDRAIDLEITSYCNAVCPFCPREVLEGKNAHMSMTVVRRIAEHLRAENGGRRVVLCGIGEPTLHPQLEDIVRELADVSSELCITTNGTRMNGALFERLVRCGLTEVNFSLNAATAATHRRVMNLRNFDGVIANVNEIVDLYRDRHPRVTVNVSFVLCDLNQHEAVSFADHWRTRNVTNVWIHPLNNRAGLLSPAVKPADPSFLEKRYADDPKVVVALFPHGTVHEKICRIARDIDFISVDGSMRLCAMDYKRATFFGHADTLSLQEMHLAKMLSYIRGDTELTCQGCDFCPGQSMRRMLPMRNVADAREHIEILRGDRDECRA